MNKEVLPKGRMKKNGANFISSSFQCSNAQQTQYEEKSRKTDFEGQGVKNRSNENRLQLLLLLFLPCFFLFCFEHSFAYLRRISLTLLHSLLLSTALTHIVTPAVVAIKPISSLILHSLR